MKLSRSAAITIATAAIIVFGLISAYTTYLGAADMIDPSKPWYFGIIPWGVAIVAFVFSTVIYVFYFNVFPVASTIRAAILAMTIPAFIALMFSMSTMLSVIGFGGDAAMQYHLNTTIQNADRKLNSLVRSLAKEQELGTTLRQLSQQFRALSDAEIRGGITGVTGTGDTTLTLATISKVFAEMQQIAAAHKEEIGALNTKGIKVVSDLRALNHSGLPLAEKVARFAVKLNELNTVFSSMQGLSVVRSVKAVSTGLDKLVLQTPNPSTAVGQAQTRGLPKVVELVTSAKRIVGDETENLISEAVQIEPLNVIDVGTAIFEYAREIKVAWAAALAADFAGLLFLGILIISWPYLKEGIQEVPVVAEYEELRGRNRHT